MPRPWEKEPDDSTRYVSQRTLDELTGRNNHEFEGLFAEWSRFLVGKTPKEIYAELIELSFQGSKKLIIKLKGIPDLTPESLIFLDNFDPIQECKDGGWKCPIGLIIVHEGAYLGEVIIKNLGGHWVYPSNTRYAIHVYSRPIKFFIGEKWYGFPFMTTNIRLKNGNLIPVMKIVKLKLKKDPRVPSLQKAYEEITSTGKWKS